MFGGRGGEPPPAKKLCASPDGVRQPSASAVIASLTELPGSNDANARELRDILLTKPEPAATTDCCKARPGRGAVLREADEDEDERGGGVQQYHCDACQKDITSVFRVRCGECPDFDLCVSCFVNGVETGSHRNDHSYIPIGRNDFPIFTLDWNADEEMRLLEGVSKFGFGNWSEIAELITPYSSSTQQPKRKEQCEEHYYSVHIVPYREQRPPALPEEDAERRAEIQRRILGKYYNPIPQPIKPSSSGGNAACNVIGFMPLRGDFDVEYDNDAELILSDIEFRGDETPTERELKLKVLDIYNARLDERILRKKVVLEKGLVDWRRAQQLGRRRGKEEIDFHNLFRLLARFDLEPDYEELANLFLAERKLRRRIRALNEWRSLGLRTFEEVETYEAAKTARISGAPPSLTSAAPATAARQASSSVGARRVSLESQTGDDEPGGEGPLRLEAPASTYPGAALLSEKELQFCDELHIPPPYFFLAKHTLIGTLIESSDPQRLFEASELRLDATRQGGALYDFILHTKLDLPPPPVPPEERQSPSSTSAARKTRSRRRQLLVDPEEDEPASRGAPP